MTTVRQSANNTIHTTSSSHYNNSHDDNLDMLLEDLQTSVSRPGSSLAMNGPVTSGYREVTRTVTNQGLNGPERSTEYHIEYINPANSTTVIAERTASPNLDMLTDTSDLPPGSRKMASYKQVSTVQYKTLGGNPAQETNSTGDVRMRQNINELDSLLDDLHTAQKTGFSADNSNLVKKSSGYDSSLIEPLQSSTPKGGHVSRSVERKVYQEQKYGSVGRQSPARELKYDNSYRQEVSPLGQRKEIYKYESKTTRSTSGNAREISPPSPPPIRSSSAHSPSRQGHTIRSYNYTSSSDQDVPRTPTMHHRSPSPNTHRSPSPAGRGVRSYNYSSNRTHEYTTDGGGYSHPNQPQPPYRSPSPTSRRTHNYNTTTTTTNQETHRGPIRSQSPSPGSRTIHSHNYSSTSTKESKQEVPKTPPPHRSPSPVSFVTPSMPGTKTTTVKTYNFEQSPRPQSPQPMQKFSPSDPSRTLNYQVSPPPNQTNVYSYKYSTHTSSNSRYPPEEHVPLLPRPFPTPSPTPDQQQQPPKKLDELMASFGDTEIHQHHYNESHRYTHQQPQQQPPRQHQQQSPQPVNAVDSYPPPATVPPSNANNVNKSKNVTGPPVYYPPGVELFSKKEEACVQQQSGGGGGKMKAKAKAKYEYESKSKSKEKSSTKKAVVPVCLPVCCAMPCVIM